MNGLNFTNLEDLMEARDMFAAAALTGILSSERPEAPVGQEGCGQEWISEIHYCPDRAARRAYEMADAMIRQRYVDLEDEA